MVPIRIEFLSLRILILEHYLFPLPEEVESFSKFNIKMSFQTVLQKIKTI